MSDDFYEDEFDEDEFDEDEFDEDEFGGELGFDCGQFIDGGYVVCSKAGTEECDWDCPYVNELGSAATEETDR